MYLISKFRLILTLTLILFFNVKMHYIIIHENFATRMKTFFSMLFRKSQKLGKETKMNSNGLQINKTIRC